ncbi:MAG: hypothetical protein ACK4R6_10775 [Spirosomataceae bacterium]
MNKFLFSFFMAHSHKLTELFLLRKQKREEMKSLLDLETVSLRK